MKKLFCALMMVAGAAITAEAQEPPFKITWPHNPMVETYTVYRQTEGVPGLEAIAVVRADQCTQGQCVILTPTPATRTCYPILSMGFFQSVLNEVEVCWRPKAALPALSPVSGSK